jgi:hypothetical protein
MGTCARRRRGARQGPASPQPPGPEPQACSREPQAACSGGRWSGAVCARLLPPARTCSRASGVLCSPCERRSASDQNAMPSFCSSEYSSSSCSWPAGVAAAAAAAAAAPNQPAGPPGCEPAPGSRDEARGPGGWPRPSGARAHLRSGAPCRSRASRPRRRGRSAPGPPAGGAGGRGGPGRAGRVGGGAPGRPGQPHAAPWLPAQLLAPPPASLQPHLQPRDELGRRPGVGRWPAVKGLGRCCRQRTRVLQHRGHILQARRRPGCRRPSRPAAALMPGGPHAWRHSSWPAGRPPGARTCLLSRSICSSIRRASRHGGKSTSAAISSRSSPATYLRRQGGVGARAGAAWLAWLAGWGRAGRHLSQ